MDDPATITAAPVPAMSSIEIAEITGKNHADVLRDIRVMLEQLGEGASRFAGAYVDAQGKTRPCFFLPEEEMLTLVSGYRVELRRAIIVRWKALEAGKATPMQIDYTDPAVLSGVLDHLQEKVAAQQAQLEAQAPKVAAHDLLAQSGGSMTITDAARKLGMSQRTLFRWMAANDWFFREKRTNRLIPYADKRKAGLMEVVASTQERRDGSLIAVQSTYVTPKGLAALAEANGVTRWP